MKKQAFTLIEILVTLLVVGIAAALSLPTVIVNTKQYEYQTGLKKAVTSLNAAIKIATAEDGDSTYDNQDLENFFKKRLNVITDVKAYEKDVTKQFSGRFFNKIGFKSHKYANAHFYTADGIIFEFPDNLSKEIPLYETDEVKLCVNSANSKCNGCGSMGLRPDDTTQKPPCLIVVDVNGDKDPNAPYIETRTYSTSNGKRITDVFSIMITEKNAIPYGVAAQKAMYKTKK